MIQKIYQLRDEIDSLENKKDTLEEEVRELTSELKYLDNKKDETIEEAYQEAKEAFEDDVNSEYEPKLEELEEVVTNIHNELSTLSVSEEEETEEVREARIALDNRNQAAILLAKLNNELVKTTSKYFVDNCYTDESFTDEEFVEHLESLPRKVKDIKNMRQSPDNPMANINSYIGKDEKVTGAFYFYLATNWFKTLRQSIMLTKYSVERAKYLNTQAEFYHRMMHALVALRDKQDSEINSMLNKLLQQKRAKLEELLGVKESELDELRDLHAEALNSFDFDDNEVRNLIMEERKDIAKRLDNANKQLSEVDTLIEEKEEELDNLTEKHEDSLITLISSYLSPREKDYREVVLPNKLIFSKSSEVVSYFEYGTALYTYQDLTDVHNFISLVTFQIRNIMEWGSVQFRVLDALGAKFVSPFFLDESGNTKTQDVFVYVLNKERQEAIVQTYNTYERRKNQTLKDIKDIGTFNTLQKERNSSVQAYQIVFIILTEGLKLDEQLILLIRNGAALGIIVHIYIKQEHVKLDMVKSVEDIFDRFVELSDSGLTYYEPLEVRERLVQEELERRKGI